MNYEEKEYFNQILNHRAEENLEIEDKELDQINKVHVNVLNVSLWKGNEKYDELPNWYEETSMIMRTMCVKFDELDREIKEVKSFKNEKLQVEIESSKSDLKKKKILMKIT